MTTASRETALALSRIRAAITHAIYADSLGTLPQARRDDLKSLRMTLYVAEQKAKEVAFLIRQADAARRAKRARAA